MLLATLARSYAALRDLVDLPGCRWKASSCFLHIRNNATTSTTYKLNEN